MSKLLKSLMAFILLVGTWGSMSTNVVRASERSTLSMDQTVVELGQPLTIHYTGAQSNKDWIGIYLKNETPEQGTNAWRWDYVNDLPDGTITLTDNSEGRKEYPSLKDLAPGEYYLAYLLNDGYTENADRFYFQIVGKEITQLKATPESVALTLNQQEDSEQLQVEATYSTNETQDVTTANGIQYVSSMPQVATVTSTGLVKAVSEGNAEINITLEGKSTTIEVTVTSTTPGPEPKPEIELTVMSLNLWSGDAIKKNGIDRVVNFLENLIRTADPDVIGIQESNNTIVTQVAASLGYYVSMKASPNVSLMSKYPILDVDKEQDYYLIEVDSGRAVAISNVHLSSTPYGPYSIADGKTVESVLADENLKHMAEMRNPFSKLPALAGQGMPVFLTGDFNVPSHLDWTEATKDRYFGKVVEWPVSKKLDELGMVDSYRSMHPDPAAAPGITWAVEGTEWRNPEVYDRIDYVYAGGPATTVESKLIGEKTVKGGPTSYADIQLDTYLSDHRAVVSKFNVKPRSYADLSLPSAPEPEFSSTLSMDQTVVERGQPLTIHYTGAQGNKDWIGIYLKSETPKKGTNAWKWGYVNDLPNGTITLTDKSEGRKEYPSLKDLAPGEYYIAYLLNDGYTENAHRFYFQIVDKASTPQEIADMKLMKKRMVDYYISRDIINDGTNGRVEWTFKSKAATYLSSQNPDGSWGDVDYASTTSAANGRGWSPYLALDRMQSMAQAFADPNDPNYHSEALLDGIQKALDYWFTVKPTSTNWWETGIGKQLRLEKIALLCEGYLTESQVSNIIGTLDSSPHTVDGANSSWYNQNYMYRGLLLEDAQIVRNAVNAFNVLSNVTTTVTGIQSDMSFFMHGKTNYTTGYGRSFARDMSFWAYITSDTVFHYSKAAIDSLSSYLLDGTRYLVRGDVADLGMGMNGPDWPDYASAALTFYEDPLQWMQPANPERAAEFASFLDNIRKVGTNTSNGLDNNNMTQWQTLVSSHMRSDYGITVKMSSSTVKGGEWRTINPSGYNLLYWTPQGATAIQRTGDEYRPVYPLMDWAHVPGTTAPYALTKDGNFNNPRTFVGGVTNERYGATAFDFNKLSTSGKKGYFFFDDEMVALGAGIASTNAAPIHTTLNQSQAIGEVFVDGNPIADGTMQTTGRWAYNDNIGYVFPNPTDFQIKRETKTGSWSDVVTGSSTDQITKSIFSIWLDHGVKPTNASYQYIVLPNKNSDEVSNYASNIPLTILSNTSSIQAVRHNTLQIAELLFYKPGTVNLRDGLTVTVDQPALVIVDESAAPVRISVSNPETPGITVNVTLDRNGEKTTTSYKLGKDTFTGRSITSDEKASIDDRGFDLAYDKGAFASSSKNIRAASNATDIYRTSYWSSDHSDNEWIYVDLQDQYVIHKVRLNWEKAYGKSYKIQVSNDAHTWMDVYSTTMGNGGIEDISFNPVSARYVRMQGVQQGTGNGYSLYEFKVYEDLPLNLAEGKSVVASSYRAADVAPGNAVDGVLTTRWGSNYSDSEWIYVDLGSSQTIEKVDLHWESAYGKEYQIRVSDDASNWTTVYSTTTGTGGIDKISFEPVNARYVQMYGTKRGSTYGYSLWEFKVYPSLITAPDAPADVHAVGHNGSAEVSFTEPNRNGGSEITGYEVTAWANGEAVSTAEGSGSPITVTGLMNGTAYTFTVIARNAKWESASSAPSNEVIPSPDDVSVPASPRNLTAAPGDRSATLRWDASAESVTYSVYQYEGTAAPADPGNWQLVQASVTAATYGVTGLTNGKSYAFAVKAVDARGESDFSNVVTATPKVPGPETPRDPQPETPVSGTGNGSHTTSVIESTNGIILIPSGRAGEVSLDKEVILTVGVGVAEQEIRIKIEKLISTANLVFDKETLVSNIFELTKNTTGNFKKPITISMKFDPSLVGDNQRVAVFYYDEAKKAWNEIGGIVNGDRITAEVDHFTKFAVMAVDEKKDENGETNAPVPSFTDIVGHWAQNAILSAAGMKLVSGYPDGTFKPNATITRAEFTVMLAKALKLEGAGSATAFTDEAKIGGWAKQEIANAVEAGIVSGYADGSFQPNGRITRAEMAAMIARALQLSAEAGATTGFADDKDIPNWAKGAIEAVRKLDIVSGRGDNEFVPNGTATRAEAVSLLVRILEQ
ncbi:discoidin domain-containing protein [Paenibacillus sp. DXFW5]|uniref:Discoidin domain-containing protein n=1 Tax=Paenibacillus rhizolycopersici TaxID=2780073 RepID=A0ABS2HAJ5_9BACL|nr:polysaccharide lyase family 8 super-sandwich domain-containing protein [Paenibacillus rhizolycopersici]MBM6996846.1 discoidin domain-containing protein [Paenibacillus rhizolycopersici]